MANVRVAVRVRPLSKREIKEGGRIIVEVDGKVAKIRNLKVDSRSDGFGSSREKVVAFGFDYCYWSVNPEDPQYASQDVIFQDLGTEVLSGAAKGYNICLFAYGQTGSGKTYTMLGTPASVGLTPRICEGLFLREEDYAPLPSSCRIKVSFLEIYNERVRDLLKQSVQKKSYSLRVREHPEMGPYVQGLSQHVVTNYEQVIQLLEEGIANRITAATHVHEASSRSHAVFTIHYTQAILENNLPSEIASKINLVDLAGSERADPSYCKDRITEGANINKSLVTLGIVISTLAQNSQVFSSCQSLNSVSSDGGGSGMPSFPSGTSSGGAPSRRQSYIPYRDSVLTWLLKDSLGGNSQTIMVATVSPAHTSYSETMSTLRYAANAKNIINKPRVNEDANVKLIRELREEIRRLKAMLLSFELRNFSSLNEEKDENLKELVLQNELKIDQLTKDWTRKWNEWKALMEHYRVDINRRRAGVVIDSSLPHLMALEDDVLSTGVVLYHLKEGTTKIGRIDSDQEQDIVLQGQWIERDHCTITSACGVVVLRPSQGARCTVNGREVTASCRLTQGAVIILGKAQKFRFNHPAEAAVLRQRRQGGEAVGGSGSLEWLDLDGDVTASRLGLCPLLYKKRRVLGEKSDEDHQPPRAGETPHRAQIQQQQCYVGDLRQRILAGQIRAKQELGFDQAHISRQIKDNQRWLLREETWLASLQQQQQQDCVAKKESEASVPTDAWLQTNSETHLSPLVRSPKRVVRLRLLRRHALRAAEQNIQRKKVVFQLERITKKQRLLKTQKRLEQLKALCHLQDDFPQKPPYQVPSLDAMAAGPQCRSRSTSCSSLSLQRLCLQYLPQLRSVFLNRGLSTTLPPMPDSTDQASESTPSEEYLPQAASYPERTGSFSKNVLRSSALTEPLQPEDPRGKECDLSEPENSESDNSQISEDSLAEKGYQSPQGSPGGSLLTSGHGHPRARARASVRGFTTSSDSGLFIQAHRSFSLDSLIDAEEDQQEEPFLSSADEMPTETFWHLQTSSLSIVGQEAVCRCSPIHHRTGARLDAIPPMSNSFYLAAQPQPPHEQPESEAEASSSEQTNILQGMQVSRGSPLLSMDSWFSCDSKINPSSPLGTVGSLCPSPDVQEFQPCGWERPGYWSNMDELKPSCTEAVLPYSSNLPPGGAELPCSVRAVYTIPASDTSRLSLWGSYRFLQQGPDGTFQARSAPDTVQQGNSEASNNSSVSSVPAASAASFTHGGSAHERDWAALQQKYLLELAHPVLEAIGEPRPAFTSLEEDSGSLTQASCKGDTVLAVGSGVSSSLEFNHLPQIRLLRAEKEQESLSVELEGTSDFFTTNEKEVSYSGNYSADIESLTSGTTNAQIFVVENKIVNSTIEAREVKQNSLEQSSQSSGKPGLMTSSDECFFLKNRCHSNITIATKEDCWPQGSAPLRKNSSGQVGQLSHNSHHPPQEEKAQYQESSKEVIGRHTSLSFAFPSGPEPCLHSTPWSPFQSSLQPPPLETFYVTKSRDALTETALEIPACREARVPSPSPREAWGFGHDFQVLQNVCLKNNLPVLSQKQNPKVASSQQVTAERTVDPNTKEVSGEIEKCPGNVKEESHHSVYFFVAQNRHFLTSTRTKACGFENQVGNLNKHSLPGLKEGKKATVQSYCNVSSDSSGSSKPFLVCESEAVEEEEQDQNSVLKQTQTFDLNRQFSSKAGSDFIYKTINLGFEKDMLGEAALPLKSRSIHPRVSNPEIMAQDESPTDRREGKNETGLPWTETTHEKFQSVTRSQERNLSERKGPGKSQETLNPKEPPSGKRPNKRVDNANEMARLIKSVMQLENGILEFESKQNKQLCASHTLGVGNEFVFRDQKDQEMADHVLRTGSSELSSPEQTDDAVFSDGEAGEMEANSSFGRDPQVQKITLNPFKSRECVQDIKFVRELTHPAVLDRPARDTCDCLRTCAAHRETNISVTPRRMKALARAAPLQARSERSSEKEGRLVHASASSRGQPCCWGSLEEWETVKGFQESHVAKPIGSSKQEEPKVQGRVKKMTMQRGESLQEEYRMVSLTQKLLSPNQRCMDTFFSRETNPLLSQPDCSAAPHRDPSNTLPLDSSRLPRSYLYTPDVIGISSVDYVMDPTVLKMPNGFWATGAGYQGQSGKPRSHSPQGNVRGGSSMAQTAWCGPVMSMAMGSWGQSSVPESIPLGVEGRRSASTSPQDQRGGPRSTSMGLSTRIGSASEAEAAVQRGTKRASSLNRASSQLEKRASCPLEDNDRGRGLQQKAEEEAEDLSPTSAAFSAPVSLPRVPQLEPSAHTSTGLAVLEEIRQAKAQGEQLHDLVAADTVLPYYETLLEPECFSRAPGRPQCQQMDQPVSGKTKYEGEAQRFHVASSSTEPGHLWTDKRKVLQATALSLDSFQPLPSTEINRGPWQPSQTSSHADPALGKSLCSGELRHFLGTGEQFICHSSPFEIIEEKKEATRIPSSADLLDSDSLPSSAAMVEDRRVIPEKVVATLSSQDPSDDPGLSQHGQSQLARWGTAEGVPPGSQERRPAHQEHRTLDTTYGGGSGNLVAAQGGKTTYFESQLMICNQNSASLSGSIQDHVQGLKDSNSLEEGRASPRQGTILLGALRRAELEAPSQQCMKWKGSVGSGLAEAYTAGSKHPRPAPFSDQRPSPHPGAVRKEAPCRSPQETSDSVVFSGSLEGRRTLIPSGGQEDSRTLPCLPLCNCQPIASHACFSPPPTLLGYKEGDLRKGTSKAAPQTLLLPCMLSSWACGMDEREESYFREPDMFLAHGLEPKGIHMKFEPTDCSTLEPSAAAAVLSLAQGCSSPSTPDVRTSSLSHSVADGSSRSIGDPEKKVAEKKASTELDAAPFPTDVYSEPLRKCQDSSVDSQDAQESQTKLQLPTTIERPHTLSLNEASVENELLVEPQHACFENGISCLLEKPQLSTKSRSHSGLDPQAKFITKLKRISSSQVDSPWEEEEEQREQASGGGEDLAQDSCPLRSDEGGLDGYQIRDAGREDGPVAKAHVSEMFSSGFEDFATARLGPMTQNPGQPSSGREQSALHHRRSLPVIAIFSGPSNFRSSPRPQFSVISSSRSLQELNLSVEPPSPTDEETWEPNKLWNPHPRGHSSGKSSVGTSLKAEDCNQKASSNLDSSTADHRPLQPTSPPYPTSSAPSCMPTPNFMTSWTSGTLEQAQQGKPEGPGGQARPEKWPSKADKGVLHFGSSDTSPYFPPWHAEGPGCIGWKQYVFGSAVDVSCGQTSQDHVPSNMARCSSMDNGLEDQNSPFHPHLSTYASAQALSGPCSSIENAQGSHEAWKVWDSSLALGNPYVLTGPEGAAPTTGPDKRAQFLGTSDEAGCLISEPPWAEGSAAGPVDEIMLLYPSEAGSPVGRPRVNTLEQGTQTLGCRVLWNHTDISSAQSEVSTMPVSDLVSWTSMHNLSLHLSQLLHSTSELLGSLSQPSVAEKERNTKRETPDEAAQTLMMDGCTQTTIDEGIQTDLASPPVYLQAPEASPQEVNVVLEVLGSDISTMSQNGHVPGTPQKRETEETAWKTAGPPDLQEESTYCRPQSPPIVSSHLGFQKTPFGQNLPSVSPQASLGASLPPSSRLEEPCLAVGSPSLSISHSSGPSPNATESVGEPRVQQELGPMSALLVDRASSPILILSASTQGSGVPLGSLFISAPAAQLLEGPQKLISSPDLPLDAPRPPMDNPSEATDDESGGSQRVGAPGREGRSPLERSDSRSFLEVTSPDSPQQSPKLQVHFLEPSYQQLKSQTTAWVQSRVPPLPPRSRSQKPADGFVPEDMASQECGPLSSKGPGCWQSRTENRGESSASPVEPRSTLDISSLGGLQHSPCPVPELTDNTGLQGSTLGPSEPCQSQGMLRPSSQTCVAPEPQHHSLRDLPVHNKFSNWCGVQHGSSAGQGMMELPESRHDLSSREQEQRPPQPPDNQCQDPERSQREQVPLQVGAQNLSLSMELTEAKLHHGFGESDALLQVLQSGTGEALAADEPVPSTWEELYARQKQTIETLRRQRAERLQNFRRTRSLSPQKQLSLLPNRDFPSHNPDLPSRRREYLQQLRKDVVETTRRPGSALRSAHPPSDIELMLREYQRAREEAKAEIARARDRLRERTEQEKLRIRQQIISQLLREEEKLHTLGTSSSLCTSSNGSLSSGVTSGYNSSPALSGQIQSPDSVGDTNLPDSGDSWIGDVRGRSTVRNSHPNLAGSPWKSLAYSRRASLGSRCCSPSSLSSLGTCFSSSYQDLAKHIVDISMADVMAACSGDLYNFFSRQAAAGWNYQGEEQEVQLYYKVFSSTRHGFLGAGVVSQPLSHVWAAVSDPTLWPLYHKPIQTVRLHQRVTNSINLVYLVCNPALCALKQPRDFCCVCVEAKEGHLSIMAAQSVYDTSMPRPSRDMVRGEILPSAWILQPLTMEGKEITRVIYLAQVELGAPGFPPQQLSSFIKQQPLVIARLASFLGS
ncbi:stAR-related lipid transfer protein 9 isoform X4 [Pteropus medius]|uniref:stAR-related lipid transfer protein 9 isoform X4 n=1 Tax=Pteropus vampyrus TaxID=132908 RepID=UPI00196B8D69|nr:stAR-related lipid transfer protein 9 isoform X4 [Pteropus giganteus]